MLEYDDAVCLRGIAVLVSNFAGCRPAVWLPSQSAALSNPSAFVFSFLRMCICSVQLNCSQRIKSKFNLLATFTYLK